MLGGRRGGGAGLVARARRVDAERIDGEAEALPAVAPALLERPEIALLAERDAAQPRDLAHRDADGLEQPHELGRRRLPVGGGQHLREHERAARPAVDRDGGERGRGAARARLLGVHVGRHGDAGCARDGDELAVYAVRVHGALARVLRHEVEQQPLERLGRGRRQLAHRRRGLLEVLEEERGDVGRVERQDPRQHLVEQDAERVEVARGARVDRRDALGRHVLRRAEHLAGAREPRVLRRARDAEVEQLGEVGPVGASREEDVLGLEVAVHDAEVVGARERARDLDHDGQRAAERHGPFADGVRERGALEQLHHEVRGAVLALALVEDLDDVGVREPLGRLRLAAEALAHDAVLAERRVEDLHRARPVDQLVARPVDGGHAPLAEHVLDEVAPRERRAHVLIEQRVERRPIDEAERAVVRVVQPALCARLHAPSDRESSGASS